MINSPRHDESTTSSMSASASEDILVMMNLKGKVYSWEADFTDSDYAIRKEKFEDLADEITDAIYETPFKQANVLFTLITEIVKNSADHSQSKVLIKLSITPTLHKLLIRFSVQDGGPGLPFEMCELTKIFDTVSWRIKENLNRGVGLNRIKVAAQVLNVDLLLHHKGEDYHVHDLGLQHDCIPQDYFGYEGVGVIDLEK